MLTWYESPGSPLHVLQEECLLTEKSLRAVGSARGSGPFGSHTNQLSCISEIHITVPNSGKIKAMK